MAIWEILFQIFVELMIEFGFGSIAESARQRSRSHPVVTAAGALLLGGLVGALTSLFVPTRIFPSTPLRGASLLLSPLATGAAMSAYGRWKERRARAHSFLASFWGGALFAFGMALVRFIWVGAH